LNFGSFAVVGGSFYMVSLSNRFMLKEAVASILENMYSHNGDAFCR